MNSVGFSKDAVIVLPTSDENKGKNMTKKIVKIIENKDGDVNPTTDLQEKPVYEILFDDSTSRKLFRHKVKEYLSMSYKKAVVVLLFLDLSFCVDGRVFSFQDKFLLRLLPQMF